MTPPHHEHTERRHTLLLLATVGLIAAVAVFIMLSGGEQAGKAASLPARGCDARAYCEGSTRIMLQADCNQVAIPCESGCAAGECVTSCSPVTRCEGDTAISVTPDCKHSANECGVGRCNGGRCI